MNATMDFPKMGASILQNFAISNGCDEVVFISKNDTELKKIADIMFKDNLIRISTLNL